MDVNGITHMEMTIGGGGGTPTFGTKEKEEPINKIINVLLGSWSQYQLSQKHFQKDEIVKIYKNESYP